MKMRWWETEEDIGSTNFAGNHRHPFPDILLSLHPDLH